jgi:hypothetical protein
MASLIACLYVFIGISHTLQILSALLRCSAACSQYAEL